MPRQQQKPLTAETITQMCVKAGKDAKVNVFCIDGVVVAVPLRKALEAFPYGVEAKDDQVMNASFSIHGNDDIQFLSAMTSDLVLMDLGGDIVENINKDTVNTVSDIFGGDPVFGDDEDGFLK